MSSILESTLFPDLNKAEILQLHQALIERTAAAANAAGLHRVALSERSYQVLVRIIGDLVNGRAVSLESTAQELTTQEAASFLGCSRQFLVRLLDDEKIAFHRIGSHRRIYLKDLVDYKNDRDRRRHKAIEQMAQDAVRDGVYDDF